MVIPRLIKRLLPGKALNEVRDLDGWRTYYIGIMMFFAMIAMPIGMAFSLPSYLAAGKWEIIFFDVAIIIAIVLILFLRSNFPFIKTFFLLMYGLALTFLLSLGPYNVRPAWLVMCVVSAAFLLGVRAAIATTAINFAVLISLYIYASPYLPEWKPVYQETFNRWMMFCVNLSLLSLMSGVPVGFLLNRMNRLLTEEKELSIQLALDRRELHSINLQLKNEIIRRNKAEAETKRLEFELRQSQKIEAIGTMAGGIAHDFNNILSAVIGYSQLALYDLSNPEETRQNITEILKAGERARDLVKQILAFSHKAEITVVPLDLSETVTDAMKMMRALIPANIHLHTRLEKSCTVLSSSTHIHQIIMNLCNNAIHAMSTNGGSLTISLAREILNEEMARVLNISTGQYIKLTVRDTGVGMSPKIVARIFDPYYTTRELGSGTGLGLSVVHGIVKSHNGAITCRSMENEGSSFDIYLPEIKKDTKPVASSETMKNHTGTESILYVDDETMLVNVAGKMLESLGYEVVTQTNSLEALNLFSENPGRFDAVITDMTMPDMTGDKLAQKILALRPDIPIIICTGYSEHMSGEKAGSFGFRGFLMKPYNMNQLAYAVRHAIDGNSS
ncbi:MAG: response regulator [Spirochaetes bacterium]|nr:response regulator [Spirochaetota bacterium]